MDSQDKQLITRSVTANDVGDVGVNGVIRMIIPLSSFGIDRLNLPASLPPYWTQKRDFVLTSTIHKEAMWAAAVGIAITKTASLSFEIESDIPLRAKRGQEIFLSADGSRVGWVAFLAKHLRDFLTTDNGAFVEIVRATKSAGSKIIGVRHLDSRRCTRTGDPEIPVIYRDRLGGMHELRDYQVIMLSDMPDPSDTYYGVGLCAASRAYPAIYKLASIEWYLREKVAGLHPLAIHIVNGVLGNQLEDAVTAAKEQTLGKGVAQYMGAVIVGIPVQTAPDLVTIPLAELPDGFNRKEEFDISLLTYADCLGLDPQDLQPLTGQALGTGAQSQVLAEKAGGKGMAAWRQMWTHAANEFILPDLTTFMFVEKDFRDMKMRADVSKARADVSKVRIDAGITTAQQELQVLVDDDELPKEFLPEDTTPGDTLSDDEKPEEGEQPEQEEMPEAPEDETPEQADDEEETKEVTDVGELIASVQQDAARLAARVIGESASKEIVDEALKHLQGKHNQRRHGWRYGSLQAARRSMRGQTDVGERGEYRRRAGMPEPKKMAKVEPKKSSVKTPEDVGVRLEELATGYEANVFVIKNELAKVNDQLSNMAEDYMNARDKYRDANAPSFYQSDEYRALSDEYHKRMWEDDVQKTYRDSPSEKARKTKKRKEVSAEYQKRIDSAKNKWDSEQPDTGLSGAIKELDRKYNPIKARKQELENQLADSARELRKKFIEELSVSDPASVSMNAIKFGDHRDAEAADGLRIFNSLVSGKVAKGTVNVQKARGTRASMGAKMNFTKGSGAKTFLHEMGHWLESANPEIYRKTVEFLEKRTNGERDISMSAATGVRGYNSYEVTKRDRFVHPYMGKQYRRGGKLFATEILSMGLEMFFDSPLKLKREDPEYFAFIFSLIRGD